MTITKTVRNYLVSEPKYRERKNKDAGATNLLMRRYPKLEAMITEGKITKREFVDILCDYATMDRAWRDILKNEKELRGTDYDEKEKLEQVYQLSLGYMPGYHASQKHLKTL